MTSGYDSLRMISVVLCSHLVVLLETEKQIFSNDRLPSTIRGFRSKTYPVFKVGKIPASSATPESTPETWGGPTGGPEGTPAGGSSSTSAGPHVPAATETPSSPPVSERDAERLRVHPSLLSPGWSAVPDPPGKRTGQLSYSSHFSNLLTF